MLPQQIRSLNRFTAALLGMAVVLVGSAHAGFDPQVGQPGSLGIPQASPLIQGWASSVVEFERGWQDIAKPELGLANVGSPENALGSARSGLVSLGDGGWITLGFDAPIADGAGFDFAVFENGFLSGTPALALAFLELAFVEVSTDGVNFFRFEATSLTQTDTQVGGFGLLDARDLNNLAGKHIAGYGTGFDLAELRGVSPLLDVDNVNFVRIIDVVGSIDPAFGMYDSHGNIVNDPYATPFGSSGFDLTGVAVLNFAPAIPEPSSFALAGIGAAAALAFSRRRRAA